MIDEKLESLLGDIFVETIDLYGPLLDAAIHLKRPISDVDETIKKIIRMKFELVPGLYEYAEKNIPLANGNKVYEWVFNTVELYKKPILEQINKRNKK
jgi:hypothetical protein